MKSLHLPHTLRPTKEGWWFLIVTFAIGLAATNTGNNLLYLIFAMMLSFIIISGLLSDASLRGLKVELFLPRMVFAGETIPIRVTIRNGKRRLPSFSVSVVAATIAEFPGFEAFFLKLGPGEVLSKNHTFVFPRRGLLRLPGVKVTTRYPFGLFIKSRRVTSNQEVVVYPRVRPLPLSLIRVLSGWGNRERPIKGMGANLLGLRPYQEGDDLRLIHWKTSAKVSQLMLKELEKEETTRVSLTLKEPASGGPADLLWEDDITLAASIAVYLLRLGGEVSLNTSNGSIPYGRGGEHMERILKHLALYEPGKNRWERPIPLEDEGIPLVIRLGEGLVKPET